MTVAACVSSTILTTSKSEIERCRRWFWLFCTVHLLVWVIMPLWICQNAPFDNLEDIAWGNQWQWGYYKHPFLAAWLSAGLNHLVHNPDLATYLLGQLSVVTCFWAMWRIAQAMLSPRLALISIMLLEGIYYYNIGSPQFNPNILMLATWGLASLAFYRAITTETLKSWLLFGVAAGLTIITKYEAPLLLFSMFLFMCMNEKARLSLKTYKPYVAVFVAFLVFMPNLWWLCTHQFLPFTYADSRFDEIHGGISSSLLRHSFEPLLFFVEQLVAISPLFFLALPFYYSQRSSTKISLFHQQFLWTLGLVPFIVAILISAVGGFWMNIFWAFPFFSFVGILLMAYLQPIITPQNWKWFLIISISLFSILVIGRAIYLRYSTYLTGHEIAAIYPGKVMTARLTEAWDQTYHTKVAYIAGSPTEVKNFAAYSRDNPQAYFAWEPKRAAWINEATMQKQGAIFVWIINPAPKQNYFTPEIPKRFPNMIYQGTMTLPMMTHNKKAKPIVVAYAFLPPRCTDTSPCTN